MIPPLTSFHAENNELWFYSKSIYVDVFSNFYQSAIFLDGKLWNSVEHYYQTQKFPVDSPVRSALDAAKNGEELKNVADAHKDEIRSDWTMERKLAVMRHALHAKFAPGTDMARLLCLTGNLNLIHESKDDLFWGRTRNGQGENMLGKILMEIRYKQNINNSEETSL